MENEWRRSNLQEIASGITDLIQLQLMLLEVRFIGQIMAIFPEQT